VNARKIGLLLLILLSGLSIELAWQARSYGFGPTACFVLRGDFGGRSFSFDEQGSLPLAVEHPQVVVANEFGRVTVRRGDPGGGLRVTLKKVVYLPEEREAREFADRIHLVLTADGGTASVSTNRREVTEAAGRDVGLETHLEVEAPPGVALKLTNDHGDVAVGGLASVDLDCSHGAVAVEDLTGAAVVRASHGEVSLSGVGGELTAEVRHGPLTARAIKGSAKLDVQHGDVTVEDSGSVRLTFQHGHFTANRIQGSVEVRGEHGEVDLADVSGDAVVETSFHGVEVARIGGDARLKTSHGAIKASEVKGAVTAETQHGEVELESVGSAATVEVSHGALQARDIGGELRAKVEGGGVNVERFRGPVSIESRSGDVKLSADAPLANAITVTTEHGGIRLSCPRESRFDLDARAEHGAVDVAESAVKVSSSEQDHVVGQAGGGGSPVRLVARSGEVHVETAP
jgi:DUF4097 and DUF4098 domain-containing protein YvlB